MYSFKELFEIGVRVVFVLILWLVGYFALGFFGFISIELGSTYGPVATNIFGCSLILLLGLYTYKEYKRLRNKE